MKKKFIIEQLEERLMLSADFQPVPFDGGLPDDLSALSVVETPLVPSTSESDNAEHAEHRDELVFIDSMVSDYQKLVDDIMAQQDNGTHFEVIVLDSSRNGIEQISETLNKYENIDAVHLFSHGSDGAVQLGDTWLNRDTLDANADAIEGWRSSLTDEADIMFYGCDLAAGQEGQALIESLSILTGADIAASTDLTGAKALGGDWKLEYTVGSIESNVAVSLETQVNWAEVLVDISGTVYTSDTTTPTATSGGDTVRLIVNGQNAGSYITDPDGTYTITSTEPIIAGSNILVYLDDSGQNGVTVTTSDGNDLSGLDIYETNMVIRDDLDNEVTNAELEAALGAYSDNDIDYDVTLGVLDSKGKPLYIPPGIIFRPGGDVTAKDMIIEGDVQAEGNFFEIADFTLVDGGTFTAGPGSLLEVQGDFDASGGTFTGDLDSTITFTSGSDVTFNPGTTSTYENITIDKSSSGKTVTLNNNLAVNGNLTITTGTLDVSTLNHSITVARNFSNSDQFTARNGTVNVTGDFFNPGTFTSVNSIVNVTNDFSNSGTFNAGSGTINVTGDFSNSNAFSAGSGTVILDGADQTISGSTIFNDLTKSVSSEATLTFTNGDTTTINGTVTLNGASGELLKLRSDLDGSQWNFVLTLSANKTISYIDVKDSDASGSDPSQKPIKPINPTDSVDSGNNVDWEFNTAPTITSTAVTTATEDAAYSYTFTVNDVDIGDTLTLSAPTLPAWLSFDPATGILSGTPTNAEVGTHNVVLRVNDGTVDVDQSFTITVSNTNDPPTITSTAVTTATEDAAYSYTFTVNDVDVGDTLTLSAPTLPAWLSFDPATGILSGTPTNAEVGTHNVVLRVNDGTVDVDQSFTITVSNTNDPPTITSTAVTAATEDSLYSYAFTVNDVDIGDTLTLSAPTLPAWLSFDPATGILSGTPTNAEVGTHNVMLRVNDGTVDVDQSFTITVSNTNDPPTITSTAVTAATEDSLYSYAFTVNDVDIGDTLTLSAPTLPAWLSFDPATGILSGTPTNAEVGTHNVVLRVNDGTVDVDQSFTITVSNTNDPPTITSTAVTTATEDAAYSYTFTVNDVDIGDTLTLSAPTLPAWLSFDPATGILSGTPTNAEVGTHNVVLRVNDGTVDVDQSFTITVSNTNDPPTITSTAVTTATEDAAYSYTFTVNDVDIGDTLTLSAPTLPAWLSFDPATGILSGTPTNAEVGTHNVVLRVNDGTVDVDQSFTITVSNMNDAPSVSATASDTGTEDTDNAYTHAEMIALIGASDVDDVDANLSVSITNVVNGTLTMSGGTGGAGTTFTFTPDPHFFGNMTFDYQVSDDDSASSAVGTASITLTPVGDTPQAGDTGTLPETLSDPIVISPNTSDGIEVTHFQITGITNGTLYHADGTTSINNGDYITLTQAQNGLKFKLASDSTFGSFNVRPSKDGVSVDPGSGSATPIISVLSAPAVPDAGDTADEPADEDQEMQEDTTADDPLNDSAVDNTAGSNNTFQKKSFIKSDAPSQKSGVYHSQVKVDFKPILERISGTQESDSSNILSALSLKQQFNNILDKLPDFRTSYENLKNSLDDFRKEAEVEMQNSETVIGSAIAVSTGLSVGYVIWMIRGGMLLSSLISSMPAWQLADPLPILKNSRNDEDDQDDESLETIIKNSSDNDDKKKQGPDRTGN